MLLPARDINITMFVNQPRRNEYTDFDETRKYNYVYLGKS